MSRIVQGTVARFEPHVPEGTASNDPSRALIGSAILDDGRQVDFDAAAFAASGLRLLRPGQRLDLELDSHGDVSAVRVPTIG
ncbi:cold-shock protein [Natronoglycomyces albus]|uniref:Cold-shock protein n=1 Tax=Natronoglycomyces albus TaxID=2811108 RepID=A0A895XX81_9ACTN|nr:cold-shock protein [Natronoglycomyces albus]QSB07126.1 cold-shock protein [Natronoglycomyces albus]